MKRIDRSSSILAAVVVAVSFLFAMGSTSGVRAETAEPFQLYTAYSKKGLSPDQYGDKVIVTFHGFRSAAPNGFYKAFQKRLKGDYTVLGFTYEYFEPERMIEEFDRFHRDHLAGKTVIYAGSSLGAFWADFFASRHGVAKVFLSNPIIRPTARPQVFLGTHEVEKRGITITVSKEMVARYEPYTLNPNTSVDRLVVLTSDDDWSDAHASQDFFASNPDSAVITLSKGGHTINYRKHFIWPAVEAWVRR